uniref:Polyhomeotic-like protein 1 n=1 Tax=Lepisosteus oculatus TaxID=7918 RepID=W5MNV2_LEPOC|nr:PREDICTED: polyhomeotic-like protein 1 [Lepisosteus oculatus]XP_015193490.1 PREDICTED: polyhomeotic-like protein 1 [Lepisosteus oculatus]
METDGDQNSGSTNGSTASGGNTRVPQISQMSLYERQAVQALQALQRQPNAAQYFQQLMLSNAQLHNLAAVQQATLAASRQASSPSTSGAQPTSTGHSTVNLSSSSGGGAMNNPRPLGPTSSAQSSALSQSVLLGGTAAGQGQMLFRVNRSLRAPLSSQLIFMPGATTAAAVATVAQQPQQQQPQQQPQQEVAPPSSSANQSETDQVQNLALRCVTTPRIVGVKTECPPPPPDRKEGATFSLVQQQQFHPNQQPQQHLQASKQPALGQQQTLSPSPSATPSTASNSLPLNIKTCPPPSPSAPSGPPSSAAPLATSSHSTSLPPCSSAASPSPSSIPLSQLLLPPASGNIGFCQPRAVTTVTTAAAHILVSPANNPAHQPQTYSSNPAAPSQALGHAKIAPNLGAQTLVVQPLQQSNSSDKLGQSSGPVPIQPKGALQSLRLPLQLPPRQPPPILPAPPNPPQQNPLHPPPHVPVQLVGARPGTLGNSQALGLAQARSCCHDGGGSSANAPPTSASVATSVPAVAPAGGGAAPKSQPSQQPGLPLVQIQQHQQQVPVPPNPTRSSLTPPSSSSTSSPPASASLPHSLSQDGQTGAGATAPPSGEGVYAQSASAQAKPPIGSLKRKSEDMSGEMEPESTAAATPPPEQEVGQPGPALSGAGRHGSESKAPPQAIVKPQVLTHLIEGFVIQEGAEPFPVAGPVKDRSEGVLPAVVPPPTQSDSGGAPSVLKCEYCENFAPASQFRGSKRFCSMTCAKRYNVSCSHQFRPRRGRAPRGVVPDGGILRRRGPRRSSSEIACAKITGRHLPIKSRSESSRSEDLSSCEDDSLSLSPGSTSSCPRPTRSDPGPAPGCLPLDGSSHFLSSNPAHWSVEEVCQFISSLQGCEELACHFLSQEIDGQALLLLKEEHLMSTMNIKLGPALKICARINMLKEG